MLYLLPLTFLFSMLGFSQPTDIFAPMDIPESAYSLVRAAETNTYFPASDLSLRFVVETVDAEQGDSVEVYRFFRRDSNAHYMVLQEEPVAQLGEGYLETEQGTWTYDPESRQFLYSSPAERFGSGDATVKDIKQLELLADYNILQAQDAMLGDIPTLVLSLQAKREDHAIAFARVWIAKDPALLLKLEEYSLTKQLLKTYYIPSYTKTGDAYLWDSMIIVNNIIEGRITTLRQEEISTAPLPPQLFSKAYIERVSR